MSAQAPIDLDSSVAITDPSLKNSHNQNRIDRVILAFGNMTAWLFPVLVIAICFQVMLRKSGHNQAWLDDAQWWMYGFIVTLAFSYAILTESHVRVDVLYQGFSRNRQIRTEIFGLGWLLLPFLILMADVMFQYGWTSFSAGEGSSSPNGLHHLYILKLSLPVLFAIAALACGSMAYRNLRVIAQGHLYQTLIAIFPAAVFFAQRIITYGLWWVLHLLNPDVSGARISKLPIMAHTEVYAFVLVVVITLASWIKTTVIQKSEV